MRVKSLSLGMFGTNCYIVAMEDQKECVLIDPADEANRIMESMTEMAVEPAAILLTHGHYDHILAVPDLQKRWSDLKVYCHKADIPSQLEEYDMGMVFPTVAAFSNLEEIKDQDQLEIAGLKIQVIGTPGHTPGSVVFQIEGELFTGDTLFPGSIGRTDFAGGNTRDMMQSLKKLKDLPLADAPIYPGHEWKTTLERERHTNPYLRLL